ELDAEAVERMLEAMRRDPALAMATLAHREVDRRELEPADVVKVTVDASGDALGFSRRIEPGEHPLRHVGVYGFRRAFLLEFASWPPSESEQRERLEQLRALDRGVRIRVIVSGRRAQGIDTPDQLAALERRGPCGVRGRDFPP